MSKPSLIFIPGAWHGPESFDTIISKLSAHGYTSKALPLQAVNQNPAVKDLQPDINALRSAVLKEADAGNDVMVIGHSWGSIIVCGGLEGLSKEERKKQGMEGGVVKLAFLTGFVPPENVSLIQAIGGSPEWWYDVKEPWVTCKDPIRIFFHDLSPEQSEYWAAKLRPHSYATKFIGTASSSWRTIPSRYLICEDDQAIPLFVQEAMVKACQDAGADMVTERVFSSHSPFLSKPDETVDFLRRAAGEKV